VERELLEQILFELRKVNQRMSQIDAQIQAFATAASTALTQIGAGITTLSADIQQFQSQAGGSLDPASQTLLNGILTQAQNLATATQSAVAGATSATVQSGSASATGTGSGSTVQS
jgi:thiamine biosynthesis lipoprotein ApbE